MRELTRPVERVCRARPSHHTWPFVRVQDAGVFRACLHIWAAVLTSDDFDYALRAWGQGTVSMTLLPGLKTLVRLRV